MAKRLIKSVLKPWGYEILQVSTVEKLARAAEAYDSLLKKESVFPLIRELPVSLTTELLRWAPYSEAQLGQDLFVAAQSGFKRNGYFVEFGATNGVSLSNTHLLEKRFGWNGILCEPARCWHEELEKKRSCAISTDCVWKNSGETLKFSETRSPELSTIETFSDSDNHAEARRDCVSYSVSSITLRDLLRRHNAPREIEYLSLDTEGSEYDILNAFDFL